MRTCWRAALRYENIMNKIHIFLLVVLSMLAACTSNQSSAAPVPTAVPVVPVNDEVQVMITGGHDTDPRDHGRPVVLIASALGVPEEVFREAFSHVSPAPAGQEPDPAQVQANKAALLDVLGPYGVTNDHLDEVSNYYRYNRSGGETWPQTPAVITAILTNGVVTGFEINDPGSGYTVPPTITVTNSDVRATASLSFTPDFDANGSLAQIILDP
jgi:hypothetical protein